MQSPDDKAEAHRPGRVRVLVVDDDPGLREAILRAFREHGYQAAGAVDGIQAIHHLQHDPFDVVVTDLQMPRLDGLGLIREARRLGFGQPIVVQTTVLDNSLEVVLRWAGAFRVLVKGGPFGALLRVVEEARQLTPAAAATLPGGSPHSGQA